MSHARHHGLDCTSNADAVRPLVDLAKFIPRPCMHTRLQGVGKICVLASATQRVTGVKVCFDRFSGLSQEFDAS